MRKDTKRGKVKRLDDYIFIRLGEDIKDQVKERAFREGCNMTIWVRQLVIRELERGA